MRVSYRIIGLTAASPAPGLSIHCRADRARLASSLAFSSASTRSRSDRTLALSVGAFLEIVSIAADAASRHCLFALLCDGASIP